MNATMEPEVLYRSNNGRGPLAARVVSISRDGIATMERWHEKNPSRKTTFEIAVWFLLTSPACGWRKQ